MKATQLIQKLQEQIKLHGDCEVWIDNYNVEYQQDESDTVSSVYFDNDEKIIRIY